MPCLGRIHPRAGLRHFSAGDSCRANRGDASERERATRHSDGQAIFRFDTVRRRTALDRCVAHARGHPDRRSSDRAGGWPQGRCRCAACRIIARRSSARSGRPDESRRDGLAAALECRRRCEGASTEAASLTEIGVTCALLPFVRRRLIGAGRWQAARRLGEHRSQRRRHHRRSRQRWTGRPGAEFRSWGPGNTTRGITRSTAPTSFRSTVRRRARS